MPRQHRPVPRRNPLRMGLTLGGLVAVLLLLLIVGLRGTDLQPRSGAGSAGSAPPSAGSAGDPAGSGGDTGRSVGDLPGSIAVRFAVRLPPGTTARATPRMPGSVLEPSTIHDGWISPELFVKRADASDVRLDLEPAGPGPFTIRIFFAGTETVTCTGDGADGAAECAAESAFK